MINKKSINPPFVAKPRPPKVEPEYRNLQLVEGQDDLWQFEVKLKDGSWKTISGLRSEFEHERKLFAEQTAKVWIKRGPQ